MLSNIENILHIQHSNSFKICFWVILYVSVKNMLCYVYCNVWIVIGLSLKSEWTATANTTLLMMEWNSLPGETFQTTQR